MLCRLANAEYDPSLNKEWFYDLVMSIMADDKDVVDFLQRFLGYCITGKTEY